MFYWETFGLKERCCILTHPSNQLSTFNYKLTIYSACRYWTCPILDTFPSNVLGYPFSLFTLYPVTQRWIRPMQWIIIIFKAYHVTMTLQRCRWITMTLRKMLHVTFLCIHSSICSHSTYTTSLTSRSVIYSFVDELYSTFSDAQCTLQSRYFSKLLTDII